MIKPKLVASEESKRAAARLVAYANRNTDEETDLDYRRRNLDADETAMLALNLEQMLARVYEQPYTKLQTMDVAPIVGDVDADAESFAWEEIDHAGEADFISDDALGDDLKSVEIKGAKQTRAILTAGVAVNYTLADIRRAARSGRPLKEHKLAVAKVAFERLVDRVAAVGDTKHGITYGLANWATGTGANQVRSEVATTADWTTGSVSAAGMLQDLLDFVANYSNQSEGAFVPDTLALPLYLRLRLAHTMFTDGRPESVLERFMRVNGIVRRVVDLNRLSNVGSASDTSRAVLMETSPANFGVVVPQPFTIRPPQEVGLGVRILAVGRIAGFVIFQPLSLRYLTALPNS